MKKEGASTARLYKNTVWPFFVESPVIDKNALLERLDRMLELPHDWDGWGSEPISDKVHKIGREIVESLNESIFGVKIFVGVQIDQSLYLEFDLVHKRIEMTVGPDGIISFEEIMGTVPVASGSFFMNPKTLNDILSS